MRCEACNHENVEGARFCAKCGALLPVAEHGPDPLIGQVIGGRFRVTGVLGEGGMGVVYVGEQQLGSSSRKVAIKTLHAHLSKDPAVLARFHRECGTIAELEHPNTIKVYDFGTTSDGTLYIAMEFVAGKPLGAIIDKTGALPPERVLKILRQVAGALDEAHSHGIIHRDLKPDNVILTDRAGETDFVKVLDFGIAARRESADARSEQKLTQQGVVLGTPPYMSPEQFTGKALDARSDVYSLGVMTYEMLTGRLPFSADTPWQWATQHLNEQPLPFAEALPARSLPETIKHATLRALSKNREQRQNSAGEFFAELSGGSGVTVQGPAANPGGTGTAAMDAMPDFAPRPATVADPGAAVPARAPAIPAVVAPPRPRNSNKSLLLGLSGAGLALLIAIVIVAARSMKPEEELPLTNPGPSTGNTTSSGPLGNTTPADLKPTEISPDPSTTPPATDPTKPPPDEPRTPPDKPTKSPPTSPPKTEPVSGAKACDACVSAARSGQLVRAAQYAASCNDSAKKDECVRLIKNGAPDAARSAALNGNCAEARAVIAAAQKLGVGTPALSQALQNSSCK